MKPSPSARLLTFATALALAAIACGGRTDALGVEGSQVGTDAATCAAPAAGATAVDNCARYCDYLACSGCPGAAPGCSALCEAKYASGNLDEACLACAVANEGAVAHSLTCESFTGQGIDGPVFVIDYSVTDCGDVCSIGP